VTCLVVHQASLFYNRCGLLGWNCSGSSCQWASSAVRAVIATAAAHGGHGHLKQLQDGSLKNTVLQALPVKDLVKAHNAEPPDAAAAQRVPAHGCCQLAL
jgi:hypothetical protein